MVPFLMYDHRNYEKKPIIMRKNANFLKNTEFLRILMLFVKNVNCSQNYMMMGSGRNHMKTS
jgi:hypothetical protein